MTLQITIKNIRAQLEEEIDNLIELEARYDELIYSRNISPNNSKGFNHTITFQKLKFESSRRRIQYLEACITQCSL